ncbi:50S ribosomal protein L15 [bacterium]|nr:50S ribosomal protein L15 [bacterium]
MANLSSLKRTGAHKSMRVGRGGKRGKTAGRGTKGQNARAGRKKRPELRDIIKKIPKRRGFGMNRADGVVGSRPDAIPIKIERLHVLFESGAEIDLKKLAEKGVISDKHRKLPAAKIVGGGELSKKLTIRGIPVSASAKAAIEKAGGKVE